MSAPVHTPTKAAPAVDSPGTWRHPRLNEITRRQNATAFTEKNVRQIAYNVFALLVLWSVRLVAKLKINPQHVPSTFRTYLGWTWFVVQIIPVIQIGLACMPLVRAKDDLSDIPLTAAQRKLLGLSPSSAPPTPDAEFSTPPRYARTPSMAGSIGSRGSYASSPLSGRGDPVVQGFFGASGSQYSPVGSPLLQKTFSGLGNTRRSSFGSASPFGQSTSSNMFSDPGTPSPSGGKRTSVGLNSKWLYERGRRSSGTAWLQ
ncbi:hypothetical protein E4U42_003728 [Claviceps africana]|uniref:Nuclear pore complex component n=1 Tax=Claviceps africana TaxID=83212 RepID=A0A8K0J6E4_9HYPO|nr:hypothetical protein E4U42_003728 [Claviceps africana]